MHVSTTAVGGITSRVRVNTRSLLTWEGWLAVTLLTFLVSEPEIGLIENPQRVVRFGVAYSLTM
jgi:hypothetical protein